MFEKNMSISFLLDFYGEVLGEKQRSILDLYYNEDLSLAEIAESCALTRQGVRHVIKKAEEQLTFLEEKLGLANHFVKLGHTYAAEADRLEEISKMIGSGVPNDEIINALQSVIGEIRAQAQNGE